MHSLREDDVHAVVVGLFLVLDFADVAEVLIWAARLDCSGARQRSIFLPARVQMICVIAQVLHVDRGVLPEGPLHIDAPLVHRP